MVMKYRKKPVVVEAVQYVPSSSRLSDMALLTFLEGTQWEQVSDGIVIHTLEGEMKASLFDWLIKGVAGEVYPCKPSIFEATYEVVEQW